MVAMDPDLDPIVSKWGKSICHSFQASNCRYNTEPYFAQRTETVWYNDGTQRALTLDSLKELWIFLNSTYRNVYSIVYLQVLLEIYLMGKS